MKSIGWSFYLGVIAGVVALPAQATIYLVTSEPATQSVGLAVLSSGPVVTYPRAPMSGRKGVGFVGWSGNARNVSAALDRDVFELMEQGSPAEQIATLVDRQIHDKYSRYIFVGVNGQIGYVFPPRGCAEPECGVAYGNTREFLVMGGGLESGVVAGTVRSYERVHAERSLPLACKLLLGLQAIISAGGEIKEFEEAAIGVDLPGRADQQWYKSSRVRESGMIAGLRGQVARSGVTCPEMSLTE